MAFDDHSLLYRKLLDLARHYKVALIVHVAIVIIIYIVVSLIFSQYKSRHDITVLRNGQFVEFENLGRSMRALMTASRDQTLPDVVVQRLAEDVRAGVAAIQKDAKELSRIREGADRNPLTWVIGKPDGEGTIEDQLDERLHAFLDRASQAVGTSEDLRRDRLAFWGGVDVSIITQNLTSDLFQKTIQKELAAIRAGMGHFKSIFSALVLFVLVAIVGEGWIIFRPMFNDLNREYQNNALYAKQLTSLAMTDGLTELANRTAFNQRIQHLVDVAQRSNIGFSLLYIDLDHFKVINDTLGHDAGDAVLLHVAKQLRLVLRGSDFVARLGGDEFAVLLPTIETFQAVQPVIGRIEEALTVPCVFENRPLPIAASVGVALCPKHSRRVDDLMRCADLALRAAKNRRNASIIYDDGMMGEIRKLAELRAAIPTALHRREFVPFYQPKVDIESGAIVGFEALVRWCHPSQGILLPGCFLSVFDTPPLVEQMTAAMVDAVAKDIRAWRDAGLEPGTVAVNMPEALLAHEAGYRMLDHAVREHALDWRDFSVEITEDVFLNRSADRISTMVARLNERGVSVALDDFGTGFASLTHLRAFPFDEIKIDRSFTVDIGKDKCAEQIIKAMIDLARNLGKKVVAEGIETPEQARFLLQSGCRLGQGYLFSKAVPSDMATALLTRARGQRLEWLSAVS